MKMLKRKKLSLKFNRRLFKEKVSDGMSREAKLAMDLTKQETPRQRQITEDNKTGPADHRSAISDSQSGNNRETNKAKTVEHLRFYDVYEDKSVPRLTGDITKQSLCQKASKRRPLNSAEHLASAMEVIETVVYGEDEDSDAEERALEELARLNSREKCLVWLIVNGQNKNCG